ncbi:HTH domain-containing protein [Candidatus Haliotispira prima]|uniref:HTH domain-containing protein n=1 Tax=Candidatus Haliotispira prima TaxID=3034016 RepID=A0ABY8MDW0_9SPIO|nr:HTH domain-containing protein [Candidatus Haliotispira prima]
MSKTALCRKILSSLLQRSQSLNDLAALCECSKTTIQRRIQDIPAMFFVGLDVRLEQNRNQTLHLLGQDLGLLREKLIRESGTGKKVMWYNQVERQTLILMELVSSPEGFAKLSVLGNFVGVTDATVLRDIKALNKKLIGSPIYSQQGVGTHIQAERREFFAALLEYFFGHLDPSTVLMLLSSCKDYNFYAYDTTIHSCVLKYLSNKVDFVSITEMISTLETIFSTKFSDISYVNIFLFFALMNLQKVFDLEEGYDKSFPILEKEGTKGLMEVNAELAGYVVGLDTSLLKHIPPEALPEMDWDGLSADLRGLFEGSISEAWELVWENIKPYLQLLHYRKQKGFVYWENMIHYDLLDSVRIEWSLFRDLDDYCAKKHVSSWLSADELLFLLETYLPADKEVVPVILVCVAGVHTTNVLRKMIEMNCSKVRITEVLSLRDFDSREYEGSIIISTVSSELLPRNSIIIGSFISKINWPDLQESVLRLGSR